MVLKKLLGSRATRALTSLSVARDAKRAFDQGNRTRAIALGVVAVVAWKFTLIGMAAQGLVKLLRLSEESDADGSTKSKSRA